MSATFRGNLVQPGNPESGPIFDLDEPRRLPRVDHVGAAARALAERAIATIATGEQPSLSPSDDKLWVLAMEDLVKLRALETAAALAPALTAAYPAASYFRTMAMILAQMPRAMDDPAFTDFADDPRREVQTARRRGARALLLVFCGSALKAALPLNLLHRWLGVIGVHVVYLRDFRRSNYDQGVPALACSYQGTLHALQTIAEDLGAEHILCFGNSLGGYAAMRFGLDLGAQAVLSFAGPTNLSGAFLTPEFRKRFEITEGYDLRPLYEGAQRPPRVHLVYGDACADDKRQALNFAGLPTVTLAAASGWNDHNVFLYTMQQRTFADHLAWLADPNRDAGGPAVSRD